jgi:PAS domain S-box-containing protein
MPTGNRPRPNPPGSPGPRTSATLWLPLCVGLVTVAATLGAWRSIEAARHAHGEAVFAERTSVVTDRIIGRLNDDAQILRGTSGLFVVVEAPTRTMWRDYVGALALARNYRGIQGVGLAEFLAPGTLAAHEARVRAEGYPTYAVRPADGRTPTSAIVYLEPFDWRNQRAFGFDMMSEAVRRAAMDRAAATGEITLSGRVVLVQETDQAQQFGTLMYLPVYARGAALRTPAERLAALRGFAYSPIRVADLVHGVLGELPADLDFDLFAADEPSAESLIFSSGGLRGAPFAPPPGAFTHDVELSLFGAKWRLQARSLPAFEGSAAGLAAGVVLGAGGLLSLALALGTLGLLRRRDQALADAEALRESEERFARIFERAPVMMTLSRLDDGTYIDVNECFVSVSGFSREEAIGRTSVDLGWITAEARGLLAEGMRREGRVDGHELELRTRDGRPIVCTYSGAIITAGGQQRLLSIAHDVTTERTLRRQLEQSQKLESIGRLAGGVAHDFNNMLAVIRGYTDLLIESAAASGHRSEELDEIRKAAEHSAEVTRQLLAFARRQVVLPRVLGLNETIAGTLKMLRRLIGEDIELNWQPGANVAPVRIDPSQVDQILANLCVNARDAIDGPGRITLSTANVTLDETACAGVEGLLPGRYVQLTVGDTGSGIAPDVLAHIFEPFFTTKEVGRGTGLGLATVYGIARQNGGCVDVKSTPGAGATFTIVLPAFEAPSSGETRAAEDADVPRGAGETLLVVEDEPAVLRLCVQLLRRLGYHALPAGDVKTALALASAHAAEIRLLVSDVVMPDLSGPDLAALVAQRVPGVRCLFMSGYTPDTAARRGVQAAGVFIQKPFEFKVLARKVNAALHAPPPGA